MIETIENVDTATETPTTKEQKMRRGERRPWRNQYIAHLSKMAKQLFYTNDDEFPITITIPTHKANLFCEMGGAESSTGSAIFPLSPDLKVLPGRLFPGVTPNGITTFHEVWVGCKIVLSYMYAGRIIISLWEINDVWVDDKYSPGEITCSLIDHYKGDFYGSDINTFLDKYPTLDLIEGKITSLGTTTPVAFEHFSGNGFEKSFILNNLVLKDRTPVVVYPEDTIYELESFGEIYGTLLARASQLVNDGNYVNMITHTHMPIDSDSLVTDFKLITAEEPLTDKYSFDNVVFRYQHSGNIANYLYMYRDAYTHILFGAISKKEFDSAVSTTRSLIQISLFSPCKKNFHDKLNSDPSLSEQFRSRSKKIPKIFENPKKKEKKPNTRRSTTTPVDLNSILGMYVMNHNTPKEDTSEVIEVTTGIRL